MGPHEQPRAGISGLLTARAVSDLTGVSESTLSRWRASGDGPRWTRLGDRLVRYKADDIAAWLDAQVAQ